MNTGGPNRTPGKPGLITNTEYRACAVCGKRVFVPQNSNWKVCGPCRFSSSES